MTGMSTPPVSNPTVTSVACKPNASVTSVERGVAERGDSVDIVRESRPASSMARARGLKGELCARDAGLAPDP